MRHWVLIAALSCAGLLISAQDRKVTGQYIEDRSSRVYGCPCEWSSEYVQSGREAVLAWSIQSGVFEGEDLAGLRLAAVLVADFTLSVPYSPRRTTLFVDQAARPSQRRAGESWLRKRYGDVLGRVGGVHVVPIGLVFATDSVSLEIRDVLSLQMRRARMEEDTETWASLLYEPLIDLSPAVMGTALHTEYASPDSQRTWRWGGAGINGYFGTFAAR